MRRNEPSNMHGTIQGSPAGRTATLALGLFFLFVACVTQSSEPHAQNVWWRARGPVVPHDTFPADCKLCHVGDNWNSLVQDFTFDHEAETGVPLTGAHAAAKCLRCHNDRAPVSVFQVQGCAGCHEDLHVGTLGPDCESCHTETTWRPVGQIELHSRTRFPLTGIHAATDCRRCHPGAEVGRFVPTDIECITCHADDLARAVLPPHQALGWVDRCDRCHLPTHWNQAEIND